MASSAKPQTVLGIDIGGTGIKGAPVDLATGKRQIVNAISVGDPAGVTAITNMRITRDGKSYAYSYARDLSGLYLVEGVH